METTLFDDRGAEKGKHKLAPKVFEQKVRKSLLWENVKTILNNQRRGTAKAKCRAEIRGGGKKPWRQKGIGWARHGSIRSPIWRKGGVVFGPKPRDYYVKMPRKKKLLALVSSLSAKAADQKIVVIEKITLAQPRTKMLFEILKKASLAGKRLLIGVDNHDRNLLLAARNIPQLALKRVADFNAYDVMAADYILFTRSGLDNLEQRCSTKE